MAIIHGTNVSDVISIFDGVTGADDTIYGHGGNDKIYGHGGNDKLYGGPGGDFLHGGAGAGDLACYGDSPEGVSMDLQLNSGHRGTAEGDTYASIEGVRGSVYDDYLTGDTGDNGLFGGAGDDVIQAGGGSDTAVGGIGDDFVNGGGGDDYITGNENNDRLYGSSGDDLLFGGEGDDKLCGGTARDEMTGDIGADAFTWLFISETGLTEGTADLILDFRYAADADRLDLDAIDADVYASGNQAFTFIGTAAFSGTPGEINYYHSGGDTYLQLQTGTSADVEGVIRLAGIHTPEASWFVL